MKKTFEELKEIDDLLGDLVKKNPKLEKTKFWYAYKRFFNSNMKEIADKIHDEILDTRIENALEDKTTRELLMEPGSGRGYKFSKEGMKNVIKKEREILEKYKKEEVEIKPYISSFIPEDLGEELSDLLKGLII